MGKKETAVVENDGEEATVTVAPTQAEETATPEPTSIPTSEPTKVPEVQKKT